MSIHRETYKPKQKIPIMAKILVPLAYVAIMGFGLVFLSSWAQGCGESYTDVLGELHITECKFNLF